MVDNNQKLHLVIGDNLFCLHGEEPATKNKWAVDLTPFVMSSHLHMTAGEPSSVSLDLAVTSVNTQMMEEKTK